MKDSYMTKEGLKIKRDLVVFEAENVNDESWAPIIKCLNENGFQVLWADGNYMNIVVKTEVER